MSTISVTSVKHESSASNNLVLTSGGDTQVIGALGLGGATYGTSGQVLTSAGSGSTPTWTTPTSLSNAEDGTGTNFEFNSGFGSNGVAYGCRAWVNFNGSGTLAIREDGNVSSVTDNGIGDYTVNFTTSMPDANYSYALSGSQQLGANCNNINPDTFATGSFRFKTFNVDASPGIRDYDQVSVAIFR